ncbi:Hexose transporter 2 [Wickerhamomyces ciferrii]|uniref:Hexose transporter 2 n=1 Tax=Wickerhamomyces ciferrii (strain ATCC 14091 / BCRC 22168 / CBS 111 / JCM 3599 / NBRC 0793 / NRRL Y-1031 F-60-10) TaxID=1206466 RepID=K0KFX4_WICCF|nr:Hexose transporter 2 [Wickerhamomyces ciferrii]CCH41816.1 Hexose transporter 2 [Wickerhamomyces ciferrii]
MGNPLRRIFKTEEKTEGSTFMAVFVGLFAACGGLLFGYDTGLINGVLAMPYVLKHFPQDHPGINGGEGYFTSSEHSLIVSILSVGTFVGAMLAPFLNDTIGRRLTLIFSCAVVFNIGVILQVASHSVPLLIAGRVIAGLGVGLLSSTVPLYQSEASPKWIRGAVVSCYQFAITIGLLLASCVNQGTKDLNSSASYRVPFAIQFVFSIFLSLGMFFLPETPRFYISKSKNDDAMNSLSRLRKLPVNHPALVDELGEIVANYEVELSQGSSSWADCFSFSNSQFKRLMTGIFIQAFQQLTGINFIFYFGTTFFKNSGIKNGFTITLITNIVNVICTIPGILLVDVIGRRKLLISGAIGMSTSELLIAIIGATTNSDAANKCMIAFTCTFIAFFASTWGTGAWVVTGEIFPLRTRAKSIAMSTASNWLWNFAIAFATPYLVDDAPGSARLKSNVFFIWGGCNFLCILFAWALVYETKGLSLEDVDDLYEKIPRAWKSKHYVPVEHKFSRAIAGDQVYDETKADFQNIEDTKSGALLEHRSASISDSV